MLIFHRVIPHKEQRYAGTVGDWWYGRVDGDLYVTTSELGDRRYTDLVLLHEQIEAQICYRLGIAGEDVTAWDMAYEESRRLGLERAPCGCRHDDESGYDRHAPYNQAHLTATACERLVAQTLGVDWDEYGKAIEAVCGPGTWVER
jgi:hypothetical protein